VKYENNQPGDLTICKHGKELRIWLVLKVERQGRRIIIDSLFTLQNGDRQRTEFIKQRFDADHERFPAYTWGTAQVIRQGQVIFEKNGWTATISPDRRDTLPPWAQHQRKAT